MSFRNIALRCSRHKPGLPQLGLLLAFSGSIRYSLRVPTLIISAFLTSALSATVALPQEAGAMQVPAPQSIPSPGPQTDQPYVPQAILPGGIVIPLYDSDSPMLNLQRITEPEVYNMSSAVHGRINSIVNIHNPSIEVHLASPNMNTGAVVILAAGGGHRTLNVGTESADFVPFFFNFGVNTVILRNRLRSDGYEPSVDAVNDAMQSLRLVRKLAPQFNFDPAKIGIMGFSAGAELSAPTAVLFEDFEKNNSDGALAGVSARPDFVGIIYPGPTPFTRNPELPVPRNAPPAFITCAGAGDRIHAIWATDYFSAMLKASIPNVEFHIYGNGYHPGDRGSTGGLTYRNGIPFGSWQDRFVEWFEDLGFLNPVGEETKAAKDSAEFVSQPPREFQRGSGRRGGQNRGGALGNESVASEVREVPGVVGDWHAKFDTQAGEHEYDFKVEAVEGGLKITAKAIFGGEPREVVFEDVKLEGSRLSFIEKFAFEGNEIPITYSVEQVGDTWKVTRKVADFATEAFEAQRAK